MSSNSITPEGEDPVPETMFRSVFARALQGHPCAVLGIGDEPTRLPVGDWIADADDFDRALLAHCVGPTLDVGCGPGRMTAGLSELGHVSLGVDLVHEAVRLTRDRGGAAITRDVFDRLPGEGRWESALLADGNIGIGGDPVALLQRMRELLAPGGRVVVELRPPGSRLHSRWAVLECDEVHSRPFRWSTVGAEAVPRLAAAADLRVAVAAHSHGSRWCAVLVRPSA